MDYQHYLATDFAADGFFLQWVKNPDPETDHFWNTFLETYPDKAGEIEQARKLVALLSSTEEMLSGEDILIIKKNILEAIRTDGLSEDKSRMEIKHSKKASWIRWAALISIPLLVLIVTFIRRDSLTLKQPGLIAENTTIAKKEIRVNPKGQKSVLRLPDGTKVWLNADSHLNFSNDFDKADTREVSLVGEAYFDVVRNPAKPFIVHTSAISIKVLGTAFNVKSYPDDKDIETTLVHGKVSINKSGAADDGSLILHPNQRAVFNKISKTVNVEQVVAERSTLWRFEKLVFDETPFKEVIAQLERWYDVTIHLDDTKNLSCNLTAEIGNEKLEEVLKLLEISHNIRWSIKGKEVFIQGALCK